jgi:hypothetical protein
MSARTVALTALVASGVSSLLTLTVTLLLLPLPTRAAPDPQATPQVVRAERFELVDGSGAVRAVLQSATPRVQGASTTSELILRDETGAPRISLLAHNDGGSVVIYPSANPEVGEARRVLGLTMPERVAGDAVRSVAMTAVGGIVPDAGFRVNAELSAAPGQQRFGPRAGLGIGPGPDFGLWVNDENGRAVWQAP